MDVEIGKAGAAETPASEAAEYVAEHVAALMAIGGIGSISAVKYQCGFGSRLHVSMVPFADAPEIIKNQGIIIKDAIAQIMSIANVTRIVMKPSEGDMCKMRILWNDSVTAARDANAGSGQDFSAMSGDAK
jgi:hypothetical protein